MALRSFILGLTVVAALAGLTSVNATAGLSSSARPSQTAPASPPPSPSPLPPPPTFDVVDPALVGTWELVVVKRGRQSRWIWQMFGDGTYKFRAEPYGVTQPHEGTMTAANGHWTLHALKGLRNWNDGGAYELHDNIAVMTGKLGTGAWKRSEQ